jgi:trans-aconitate methyltransferase
MADDLKATYNRIAADWNEDHKNDIWWIAGADKLVSFLKTGNHVLDVGCAGGVKTEYLAQKGLVVTGLDFSEAMIALAKKSFPNNTFLIKDINEPLALDDKFDGIFAQAVLLHVAKTNIKAVLARLVAQLKPGGYLYVAVKKSRHGEPEELLVKENGYGYEYERFFSFYSPDELKGYLTDLHLNIVFEDISSIVRTVWYQVIAKNK